MSRDDVNHPAISAQGLTKFYGRVRGVVDLDLQVEQGEVFGFLGPNGAGKTTTIRLLLDLIRPTRGRAEIFGLDTRRQGVAVRRQIGYMPGDLRLYDRLTGSDLVHYFARLRGMDDLGDADALAQRLELDLTRPIRELSRGNRQKVGLVQACMHRPGLLVLDEPTAGLDPLMQEVFGELVREAAADGRSVLLSSHVLSEVQHAADRVGLIRDGRLELVDAVEALRARALTRVEATFADPPAALAFENVTGAHELERNGPLVLFEIEGEIDPLLKELARHHVLSLDSNEPDLEDIFLRLYRKESHDA